MASSGVQVPSNVIDAFQQLKIDRKFQFLVVRVSGTSLIPQTGTRGASFDAFAAALSPTEACYGIYDSPTKNKLILVHWNPEAAPVKSRMLVSTTLKAVQDALEGLGAASQVTDRSELQSVCV